jgi:hypothetical protein
MNNTIDDELVDAVSEVDTDEIGNTSSLQKYIENALFMLNKADLYNVYQEQFDMFFNLARKEIYTTYKSEFCIRRITLDELAESDIEGYYYAPSNFITWDSPLPIDSKIDEDGDKIYKMGGSTITYVYDELEGLEDNVIYLMSIYFKFLKNISLSIIRLTPVEIDFVNNGYAESIIALKRSLNILKY